MKRTESGQSLVETSILSASIAIGALALWAICNEKITHFIDLVLAVIASPVP
jgi:hypothetical protein